MKSTRYEKKCHLSTTTTIGDNKYNRYNNKIIYTRYSLLKEIFDIHSIIKDIQLIIIVIFKNLLTYPIISCGSKYTLILINDFLYCTGETISSESTLNSYNIPI